MKKLIATILLITALCGITFPALAENFEDRFKKEDIEKIVPLFIDSLGGSDKVFKEDDSNESIEYNLVMSYRLEASAKWFIIITGWYKTGTIDKEKYGEYIQGAIDDLVRDTITYENAEKRKEELARIYAEENN